MGKLFGTDGVRDVANTRLSPELAFKLGRTSAGILLERKGQKEKVRIVIGKDTRLSGEMLEAAMVAGITSVGADVLKVGVIPTPAVAFLTMNLGADAGVMISASHNPIEYNGIKFFSSDGFKLPDSEEETIESLVLGCPNNELWPADGFPRPVGGGIGRVYVVNDAEDRYVGHVKKTVDREFSDLRIVVDCAHGAAFRVAPRVLRELGAVPVPINAEPDGMNVNVGCGSTHPDPARRAVLEHRADLGVSHDGDADRVIAVDERGELVDGDRIMAICGLHLLRKGELPHESIVATVYSNLGLNKAFEREGGRVVVSKAGDRYVLEEMRRRGIVLGGEQSGHVIFLDHNTTGDGIITALQLISVIKETGSPLSELAGQMEAFPQLLINVKVRDREEFATNDRIAAAIKEAEERLGDQGRIFVRTSGTEPLVRILGEGPDSGYVEEVVMGLAQVIERELA